MPPPTVATPDTRAVVFELEGQRYALPLAGVERIVRAAAVTPLPGAPEIVLGALDLEGSIVPVLDLRKRLLLPGRQVTPSDQFVIVATARRRLALVVDAAIGVIEHGAADDPARLAPGLERFRGILAGGDGLVLIHDLEAFLSLDEADALDRSLRGGGAC